jgi:hypothetical protein
MNLSHFREDLTESLGPWTFHHSIGSALILVLTVGIAGWQQLVEWIR